MSRTPCTFVPPHLLRHLAEARPDLAQRCERALVADDAVRLRRSALAVRPGAALAAADGPDYVVHTAANTATLPGDVVRSAGDPASGDVAVDEAADGIAASLALFSEVYDRDSYDGAGATVSATVHYERDYANAFWDGVQLVFGDGDGEVFDRFTKSVDVLAHELAHAVTERTAGLVYEGQSGALNESVSDVFASCLKQRLLGQSAAEGDWLIGADIFRPGVSARGLRDMAAPGTAYDDPALGRDPQPAHLDDYVQTTDDNGGVHLNSGIPNRAFHLTALAVGGSAAEGAGRIWYAALTGGAVDGHTDFAGFAAATIAAAGEHAEAVATAWAEVGVTPGASPAPGLPSPATPVTRVAVRRSGGFAGLVVDGVVDLDADADDDRVGELRLLVDRVDTRALTDGRGAAGSAGQPDRYVYSFDLGEHHVDVPEQALTDDLRRVADLVLRPDVPG